MDPNPSWLRTHWLLLITLAILLSIVLIIVYPVPQQKVSTKAPTRQNLSVLFIKNVIPKSSAQAYPKKITIEFSDPVDPAVFLNYFFISPEIKGNAQYGRNKKIIEYTPQSPFPEDFVISYRIASGLPSVNGKILQGEYVDSFYTSREDNQVLFTKNYMTGRVLSFANNKPVEIEITNQVNDDIAISLYASTQAKLLNYLVYDYERDDTGEIVPYTQKFIRNSIVHTNPIQTYTMASSTEKKKFDLKPGVYYLEASDQRGVLGSTYIIVNSVGVLARQDDKKITLTSYDFATNKMLSVDASMGLYNMDGVPQQLENFSYEGFERSYAFNINRELDLIIGTIRGETVIIPLKLPQSQADLRARDLDKTYQLFVYTDRPIYKPKDTVKFSGILRIDSDSLYKLAPAGKQVSISMGNNDKQSIIVSTNEHGVFSGEFILPEDAGDTQYLVATTSLDGDSPGAYEYVYFNVASYVKPDFELTTAVEKMEYLKNDTIRFTIAGSYFDGQPLKNTDVSYALYGQEYYETEKAVYNSNFNVSSFGGMCGGGFGSGDEYFGEPLQDEKTAQLNTEGKLVVDFTLPANISSSKKITLVAKKIDKANNEIISAANTIAHVSEYNAFFMPATQLFKAKEELVAPFYIESLSGEKITNHEVKYSLLEVRYEGNSTVETAITTGKTKTNENGVGVVKFAIPEKKTNDISYLVITTTDSKGNEAEIRKNIVIPQSETDANANWSESGVDQTYLKIVSSKNSFVVGDTITLTIRSPKELDVLMSLERGRIYEPRILRLFPGNNTVDLTVTEEMSPSITVVFSFFTDGMYRTEGLSLNIPAMHKVLNVSVASDKKVYKPQDTANLAIRTTNSEGYPIAANLTVGIVDKAIFSLRKSATPPIHSAMYYFRSRETNASSSLTAVGSYGAGGMGGGGGGGADISRVVDTLYWNPNMSTDTNGVANISIPLKGFETTWKASVLGSTDTTEVGQGEVEFIVTSREVLGIKTRHQMHR